MSLEPRFAIVLCAHNGASYIDAQLATLLEQDFPPACIELHDWCSDDDTLTRLYAWATHVGSSLPISVHEHESAPGPCASFFCALESCLARSPDLTHFLFCDQDDLWRASKLSAYRDALIVNSSGPDMLFGDVRLVDETGTTIADSFYARRRSPYCNAVSLMSPDLALVNPAIGMTVCISRRLAEEMVACADAPWAMHDWAAAILCRVQGWHSEYVPQVVADYRQHSSNERGAPGFSRLGVKVRRFRKRLEDLRALRSWCLTRDRQMQSQALALIPASRYDAFARFLQSSNLGLFYRSALACAALMLW